MKKSLLLTEDTKIKGTYNFDKGHRVLKIAELKSYHSLEPLFQKNASRQLLILVYC